MSHIEKIKQETKEIKEVYKVNRLKSLNCSKLSPINVCTFLKIDNRNAQSL